MRRSLSVLAFLLASVSLLILAAAGTPARMFPPDSVSPIGVHRLASSAPPDSKSKIDLAQTGIDVDGYEDYGTVRIGRIERPARLLSGRHKWIRQVPVGHGRFRYEVSVGAVAAPVIVRIARPYADAVETHVAAGSWTRVSLDLDPAAGAVQRLALDVEAAPGGFAAWGAELMVGPRHPDTQMDVVLISLDTVRRDQLTPYAPDLPTTPTLAALAKDATVFERAISTSGWTIASHATLFTGRYLPDSLGYSSRVEPEEYTLPEIFAASGYRTFGVSGGPFTDPRWGLHQGFDEYIASGERENARDATSRAIAWMDRAGPAPAFVFLNLFDAHEPLALSPEVRRATGVTEDVPTPMWFQLETGRRPMTSAARHQLLTAYRAELTSIDSALRRLFDYLQRSGRWDRTLVVVWADHGQLLGERGHIGHAYTLEEELLRVPLIIKPAAATALRRGPYGGLIQNDDLFEVVQALAGLPTENGVELLAGINQGATIRPLAFAKIHHDPQPELVAHPRWRSATQWAVSDGATKIVRDLEARSFAYDVRGAGERSIDLPGPNSTLITALERFRTWTARARPAPSMAPLSPAERERLRSLGYIH